jgi:hypothetical protein
MTTGTAAAKGKDRTVERFAPIKKIVVNVFQGFFKIFSRHGWLLNRMQCMELVAAS